MSALPTADLALLHKDLATTYVAHLPPLLDTTKPADQKERKNLSRAFSAFALHHITGISEQDAAQAVTDDFDDVGVDAIYYHSATETLYFFQSKLKASEQFSQDEALAFCQGVRKLIQQDFAGFNATVQNRKVEICGALEACSRIQLVLAHTGSGITSHAKAAIESLLADSSHGEERLAPAILDYDATRVIADLRASKAFPRVDARISLGNCSKIIKPRTTYFGLAKVADLVALHKQHGKALYEKNIRTFLGHTTEVNKSIQKTLGTQPSHFVFLNNGITVLCQQIHPKDVSGPVKRLKIEGFSVINGAQTIASAAKFVEDNATANIDGAQVSITLIQADSDTDFGKSVTRARNHQNPVHFSDFVALDDEQDRLRRDLAHLGIYYICKAEAADGVIDDTRIRADEAAHALALFHPDPRYVVWLKHDATSLLDTASGRYKNLFSPSLTAFQLANAVRFYRYVSSKMKIEAAGYGPERLTYKHGVFAFGWALAKRVLEVQRGAALFSPTKLSSTLSTPADQLRQVLWDKTKSALGSKSPLTLFRGQNHTIPVLASVLIDHYGLKADPAVAAKQSQLSFNDPYPKALFDYLILKAPQIADLS